MREYTVTKEILNIRSKPSDESDDTYVGYLLQGDTVWLDEIEIVGTIPKGGTSGVWLTHNGNNVVAKDGVRLRSYEDKKAEFIRDKSFSYLHNDKDDEKEWNVSWAFVDLEIWKIWRDYKSMGEGVEIAIIDSGIAENNSTAKYSAYFNYERINTTNIDSINNSLDIDGHGTKIASILASNGKSLVGIAPNAKLFVCKYYNIIADAAIEGLIKALKLIPLSVDIISISTGYLLNESQIKSLQEVVNSLSANRLIFCSVGDDNNHDDEVVNRYPSSLIRGVISVASINQQRQISTFSTKSDNIQISAPGEDLKAIDSKSDTLTLVSGTSFSAPVMAGIAALLKSYFTNLSIEEIKDKIIDNVDPAGDKQLYGHGVTNPLKAFL